jgi:hypothetical protein
MSGSASTIDEQQGGKFRPLLLEDLGRAQLGLGRTREGTETLERTLAQPLTERGTLAYAQWTLAQIILERDRRRSISLARQARAQFLKDRGERFSKVKLIDAWLATHKD